MLINKTPHVLTVVLADGAEIKLEPVAPPVRCSESPRDRVGAIDGVPLLSPPRYGAIQDLPSPQDGTFYVVSLLVAQAAPERQDLLVVADTVRDPQGKIIGCKGLARIS